MDYFERGLEFAIERGLSLQLVDVTRFPCIEIDFVHDLDGAKAMIGT